MTKSRYKTLRVGSGDQRRITDRMIRDDSNESDAIRSLIRDGAGVPQLQPLAAQVARAADLAAFVAAVSAFHKLFMSVRSRLAMALPDPEDKELVDLVTKWRATSALLEIRARDLYERAERLAETMMGLTQEDCTTLRDAKKTVLELIKYFTDASTNSAETEVARKHHAKNLNRQKSILRALEVLGF